MKINREPYKPGNGNLNFKSMIALWRNFNKLNKETGKFIRYLHDEKRSNTALLITRFGQCMKTAGYFLVGTAETDCILWTEQKAHF